jgi:hypothetical protein
MKRSKNVLRTPTEESNSALSQEDADNASVDSSNETSSLIEDNFNMTEDMYDREHWHRALLKAYARQLNWCLDDYNDPAALLKNDDQKLRVELDKCIPINIGSRRIWYELQREIRNFAKEGLLIPARNFLIPEGERWRNFSPGKQRRVTPRMQKYLHELFRTSTDEAFLARRLRRLMPNIEGQVTLHQIPLDWRCRRYLYEDEDHIHLMADRWYWKLLLRAEVIEPDRRPNSIAKVRVRYHRSEIPFNRPKQLLQSHLYYLMDAIDRNRQLTEPSERLLESIQWC